MASSKLFVHGCGGAGVTLAHMIQHSEIGLLTDEQVSISYMDTTARNTDILKVNNDIQMNITTLHSENNVSKSVDGGGGDRTRNYQAIRNQAGDYLDKLGVKGFVQGEVHVIIYSSSRSSGSVIGPVLHNYLLQKGASVISVVIGDSDALIHATNTRNTLIGLNEMGKKLDKPVMVRYFDNNPDDADDRTSALEQVNVNVVKFVSRIQLFMCDGLYDMDSTDIAVLLDPSIHSKIDGFVQSGIHNIDYYTGDSPAPDNILSLRSLSSGGISHHDVDGVMDVKHGDITSASIIDIVGGILPVSLYVQTGTFADILNRLEELVSCFNDRALALVQDKLSPTDAPDDIGMVL